MKNQYVGDIGDYGKYALLRALIAKGYSIGVNWYLTADDGKTDGKFTDYLKQETDSLDKDLFSSLKKMLFSDGRFCPENRSIAFIESSEDKILGNTVFFSEKLDYSKTDDHEAYRKGWVDRSLHALGQPDFIFLDPDNGFEVESVSLTSKKGNKYVTYKEALQYYEKAKFALIVYNHRDRSSKDKYKERFTKFYGYEETKEADVYRLTFRKSSVRDYIFITKREHTNEINDFLHDFTCLTCSKCFNNAEKI